MIDCLIVVESTISHYSAAVEKDNVNFNKIILTMKNTKLYVPVVTLTAKDNLRKGFEKSVYWNKYKTKSKSKNTTNEYINFLEWNFVGVKGLFALVIYEKVLLRIITSSPMEKTFVTIDITR